MNRFFFACVVGLAGILIAGCDGGGLTPNQKAAANKQWNDARAGVLASLASDQYKTGNLDKCQETLDEALRLEPENANLHLLAAKLGIEQGKLEIAQSHLALAGKYDPQNPEVDYLSGVILQRWQLLDQARKAYAAAATKAPDELSYLLAEAETLVAQNRPADALVLLQSKAAFFEHSGVIRDEIGQLLVQQKQYADAINMLREASILANDDPTIREHLAFALLADHQYAEAGDHLARLCREPGYDKRADVFAAIGDCQSEMHQPALAKQNYQRATELNPACCGYWLGLGQTAIQLGDLPAAESHVARAMTIDPASSDAQCLLGLIKLQQSRLPESLEAFRAAARLKPDDSECVSLQGYVLSRMGRIADAQPFYARALKLNPSDGLANRLMLKADSHD
jgi:tetratricopeptide (TPR) repeat protein